MNRAGYEGAGVAFVSGALSGTTAALATSPFDVLKTRRQALVMSGAAGSTNGSQAVGLIPVLKEIIATEGVSALYAGILPRIAKIAPACGIMIACFEVCVFIQAFVRELTVYAQGIGKKLMKPNNDEHAS